jgi:hypothetical protein
MESRLPLSALLSQALVAFIVEFDNEFEHKVPHRTSDHASTPGAPWLVSMAMWSRFMRFVSEDGTPIRELQRALGVDSKAIKMLLGRMGKWWGYVVLDSDGVIRPTAGGRKALTVWQPLTGVIERRWRNRFGETKIDRLCETLEGAVRQLGVELPDSLPILGYGLFSSELGSAGLHECSLPGLLSKLLLAFALEFEKQSEVSFAISANVLRLFEQESSFVNQSILVRDLPRLSGVSKEAIATAISFLEKRGYAQVESSGRTKALALKPKGHRAGDRYRERIAEATRFENVRESLNGLTSESLLAGLEPHPDGWRASIPRPTELPHYPMILHRGGFPDGS